MQTNQSSKIIVAGLCAVALLFTQFTSQATTIVGPYTADANTLHLWHMDASVVPVPDMAANGTNLAKLFNGAALGTTSYSGFGTALSTLDGGQNGIAAGNTDAYATPSSSATVGNVVITLADSTTGAFTMEAIVWIGFDPAKNFGLSGVGGNGRNAPCQLMSGESNSNPGRLFQFRIAPLQTANANTTVRLEFVNPLQGGVNQLMTFPIPTTGPDAIASNSWYHVAVAYNGSEGTTDNMRIYWTLLDGTRTNASQIATTNMLNDLRVAPTVFAIGNIPGRTANANFLGLIDEVRISSVARGSNEMMFSGPAPLITSQPAEQPIALGQPANLSVKVLGLDPLSYQWRLYGTNVPGATQSAYAVATAQSTDVGPYDVVITNTYGAVTSTVASITVRAPLNLTWFGTAGSAWDTTTTNWVTDTSANVAYSQGDNVTFDNNGSAVPSVNLTGPFTPSAVVVNAANNYTLSSSVGGGIVGSTGLTKSGAGMLVLDTDNSYTGPTLVQGGIVQLGAADGHGSLGTGPVTNSAAIVVNRTGTVSFNNTLAGAGSLTNLLAGSTISIAGPNTLSGPIVLNAGTLSLTGPQAAGNSANIILNAPPSGTGSATVLTLSGGVTLGSGVTLSMLGTVDVPSDFRCNLTTGNSGLANTVNGPIILGGGGSIQLITGAANELDINGSISAPDFTGKLVLRGSGVGHIYGTVNLPSANHISTTDGGTWVLHSTGNSWTNSNLASGTFRLAANNALPPGLILQLGGTLDLGGFSQQLGGLTNIGGSPIVGNSSTTSDSTLTLATAGSWTFGGVIQDAVGVGTRKVGLTIAGGALMLTNVSTYTGDTLISAGTLALSGAGSLNSSAGTISIAAGATFDVSGVTAPPYHVRTGKTLSGGGITGGATINGALVQNGGGFLALIYVSGTPAINVTGGELTLSGCATTVTVSGAPLGIGSYKLISAGAGGSVAGTLPGTVTVGGSGVVGNLPASLRITSGELWLDVSCPMPTTANAGANQQFCETSSATLTANNPTVGQGTWTVVSGAGAFSPDAHTYNATVSGLSYGPNVFAWTIHNDACPDNSLDSSNTVTITRNQTPAAPTAGSDSPVFGFTLHLTASTISGATYAWTGPNGFSSALQNPTIASVTPAASGQYDVTATVNGCTSSAGTTSVTINPASTTNNVYASPNPSLPGAEVTFTAAIGAVPPGAGTPTGTVLFKTNGVALCDPIGLDGSGVATLITNSLPHGSNTVTAEYAGDSSFLGSTNSVAQVVNTAPTSPDLPVSLKQDQTMVLHFDKLLTNASDADAGDTLSVTAAGPTSTNGPASNVVLDTGAGTITYTPATGYIGADSFTYTISDNYGATVTPTVFVTITSASAPPPNIVIPPAMLPNGHFHVGFAGIPGYSYTLQYSDNANGPWTTITSLTAGANGLFEFEDPTEPAPASRYYRTTYP